MASLSVKIDPGNMFLYLDAMKEDRVYVIDHLVVRMETELSDTPGKTWIKSKERD